MKHEHSLTAETKITVRFNECDPLGIVWHGNYAKYFEEGREAFCRTHGLDYLDLYNHGFSTPLIHMDYHFKRPLRYRDVAVIQTNFRKTPAAKIIFDYVIHHEKSGELVCKGSTTQVFVENGTMALMIIAPEPFTDWKKKAEMK